MEVEDDIAEKLRQENPEQFLILVRMHLSFIIDLNTDENDSPNDKPKSFKWGFSKKIKNLTNENGNKNNLAPNKVLEVFHITEDSVNQLYQLIDILKDEKYVGQEGIFRRTGSLSRQQQLRKLLSTGAILSKDGSEDVNFSVHDMASVLKGILADTPEPLLVHQNYQAFCHLAATNFNDGHLMPNSENRLIDALRLLLLLLPALDRHLAKRLLLLLYKTSLNESSNRMSSSALSTMFSPHVMCPRRISPESLHMDSQILAPILSLMIENAPSLFTTPPQLATDIVAYLTRRQQRKLLSPNGEDLNESVSEHTAANTVFTFVDRQMSGVADNKDGNKGVCGSSVTDTALAQLYAYIQALPESQNKRRLIKQFNRENGCGTPLQLQRAQKQRSIGQSLKKHIFNKTLMNKTAKKSLMLQEQGFGYQSITESPLIKTIQKNTNIDPVSIDISKPLDDKELSGICDKDTEDDKTPVKMIKSPKVEKSPNLTATPHLIRKKLDANLLLTSTPKVANILITTDLVGSCSTPIISNHVMRRGSMSPITKSAQKMPKAMQESIMTPRSRKPVIINCDPPTSSQQFPKEKECIKDDTVNSCNSYDSSTISSSSSVSLKNDSDFVSTDESCPSTSYCIKYKRIDSTNSSKTNKLTSVTNDDYVKKKRRIFDESSSNGSDSLEYQPCNLDQSDSEYINHKLIEASESESNCSSAVKTKGLSEPFRQYLLCRSILTKSPVDLSFVSESGDFSSVNIENLSENKMTDSLLHFLNGNTAEDLLKEKTSKLHNRSKSNECESSNFIDKENISPGSKRSASQNDNMETESKKMTSNKNEKKINKSNARNCLTGDLFELRNRENYSNCDVNFKLRETNL